MQKRFYIFANFFLVALLLTIPENALGKLPFPKKSKTLLSTKKKSKPTEEEQKVLNSSEKDIYQWFRTVSEVVSLVDKKAFRNVDFSEFIQESLKAAVPHVDAHSAFFSKESYKNTLESTSGEFSGIGVSVTTKTIDDDTLVIVDVIQGGPSDKVGLKSGDKIIDIDGEKLRGLSTDEVITKLKGKVGTELKLTIIRDKKPIEFKVIRDIIKDQSSMCYYYKNQNIYYLSLKLFTENSANQMAELLQKANDGKCKGIILDLRRNPGGILDAAVEMAGLFVEKESLVVITKDRDGKVVAEYSTKAEPILKSEIPIFILIDNFTASASEILAGCLKYYSSKSFSENNNKKKKQRSFLVFLVGTPTFGKGSVQEVIPISNGCALKLTTMLYYLPNQESIQAGIEPDFLVKPKIIPVEEMKWIEELFSGKESTLKYHITIEEVNKNNGKNIEEAKKEVIKTDKKEEEKSWEERLQEALSQDVQIQASINMINLLDIAKKYDPKQVDSRQKAIQFLKENFITDEQVELEKVK